MLIHGLQRPRAKRSVPSCFVLTMFSSIYFKIKIQGLIIILSGRILVLLNFIFRLTPTTFYLITLSALARTLGGMVTPICLAAFRLIISSNFVGCSTGRSAGFAPFKILSTITAERLWGSSLSAP